MASWYWYSFSWNFQIQRIFLLRGILKICRLPPQLIRRKKKKWGTERLSALPKVAQATSRKIQTWIHIPAENKYPSCCRILNSSWPQNTWKTNLSKMIPFNSNPTREDSQLSIPFFQVLNCMYILIMVKRKFLKNIKI